MACFSGLVWRPVTLGLIDDTLTFLGMISETHPEIVNISLGLTSSFIVDRSDKQTLDKWLKAHNTQHRLSGHTSQIVQNELMV